MPIFVNSNIVGLDKKNNQLLNNINTSTYKVLANDKALTLPTKSNPVCTLCAQAQDKYTIKINLGEIVDINSKTLSLFGNNVSNQEGLNPHLWNIVSTYNSVPDSWYTEKQANDVFDGVNIKSYIAGEDIPTMTAIIEGVDGKAYKFDNTNVDSITRYAGVSTFGVLAGENVIAGIGIIGWQGFSPVVGGIYYVGEGGALTTTKPSTEVIFAAAIGKDSEKLNVIDKNIIQQGVKYITYDNLVGLLFRSNELEVGYYCITDFATKYTQPVTNDILTGAIEPLIVLATSSLGSGYADKINSRVYSMTHPDDEIYYELTTDIDIAADKGAIYFRKDKKNNNSTFYDFRVIQYRRYGLAPILWNNATPYSQWNIAAYGGDIYVCKMDNTSIEPTATVNWKDYWRLILPSYSGKYISWTQDNLLLHTLTIPVDNNIYHDYYTFSEGTQNSNIGLCLMRRYNNIIINNVNNDGVCDIGKNCYEGNIDDPIRINLKQDCNTFIFSTKTDIEAQLSTGILIYWDFNSWDYYNHINIENCSLVIAGHQSGLEVSRSKCILLDKNVTRTKIIDCEYIVLSLGSVDNSFDGCGYLNLPANSRFNTMHNFSAATFDMTKGIQYNNFMTNTGENYTLATHVYNQYHCTIQDSSDRHSVLSYLSDSAIVIVLATS